jgi:hypothetical protein
MLDRSKDKFEFKRDNIIIIEDEEDDATGKRRNGGDQRKTFRELNNSNVENYDMDIILGRIEVD